ncbi:MAG: phosphatidylglycerophosphatase A [Phycisphaerae bacterium]|nr:phosphatidylglycerophosphatase A [Phycisphaerae bacterium]
MSVLKRQNVRWITVFGLGYWKPASGTWGSLPPVALAAGLIAAGLGPAEHPLVYNAALALVVLVFSLACIWQGDRAEAMFLRKDPGQAVADETAGQALVLLALPAAAVASPGLAAFSLALAFFAFRALDILKPFPARQLQRVPGGWGILLDDLFAGAYAWLGLQIAARFMLG